MKNSKIWFYNFFFSVMIQCRRTYYSIMGDILSLQEIVQIFLDIAYICPTDYFLSHKYSVKGFFKEFTLLGISVAILLIKEVVGTSILIVRLP